MAEKNISQGFRLKNIDTTRNYLIEKINRNELMSKKHKTVCTTLNYSKKNYEFCNWIKNLCNNCRNQKV